MSAVSTACRTFSVKVLLDGTILEHKERGWGSCVWSTLIYTCIHTVPPRETWHVIVPSHFLPIFLSPEAGGSLKKAFHLLPSPGFLTRVQEDIEAPSWLPENVSPLCTPGGACLPSQSGCHCPLGAVLVPGRESWGILMWNNLGGDKVDPMLSCVSGICVLGSVLSRHICKTEMQE